MQQVFRCVFASLEQWEGRVMPSSLLDRLTDDASAFPVQVGLDKLPENLQGLELYWSVCGDLTSDLYRSWLKEVWIRGSGWFWDLSRSSGT